MREINEKLMNTAKLLVANNFFGTIRIRTFPLERDHFEIWITFSLKQPVNRNTDFNGTNEKKVN